METAYGGVGEQVSLTSPFALAAGEAEFAGRAAARPHMPLASSWNRKPCGALECRPSNAPGFTVTPCVLYLALVAGIKRLWVVAPLAVFVAACGSDHDTQSEPVCGAAVGNWRFGDGNLYMSVDGSCRITNFCSIRENIHTTGSASATELQLASVGGMPLAFLYSVSGEQLIIIDGFQDNDLQLARLREGLPATCPNP